MSDDDLDKMAARLKAEWGIKDWRPNTFAPEDKPVADKLLGKGESQRLQRRRDNSRPFKHRPPVVTAEYFWVPGHGHHPGGWRIDVRQNGVVRNSSDLLGWDECMKLVAALERKGVKSKKLETERMKQQPPEPSKPAKPESRRRAILEDLGGFRR